jgi:monoamine oxidase
LRSSPSSRPITTPISTAARLSAASRSAYRTVKADYHGHVAELLAKATRAKALDAEVSAEDQEKLLESRCVGGALDNSYRYVKG